MLDQFFELDPYSLPHEEKEKLLLSELSELTEHHRSNCPEYAQILEKQGFEKERIRSTSDIPYIPVRLFKEYELLSVSRSEIAKTMTSSGTSGQAVSKIFLDKENTKNQTKTLAAIITSYIGKQRLPLLLLDTEMVKHKAQPANDEALFTFAQSPDWQNTIDLHTFERTKAIIAAYNEALNRLRYIRHIPKERKRQTDIERILFARGQENQYSIDELYHAFDNIPSFEIRRSRIKLSETAWHLTPPLERMVATYEIITGAIDITYRELFCDFRCGGYRILGDIICDLDDMYRTSGISDNLIRKNDSDELQMLLTGIDHYGDYKQILIRNCMYLFVPHTKEDENLDLNEVLKCVIALGERQFALEVMPSVVLENCRRNKQ